MHTFTECKHSCSVGENVSGLKSTNKWYEEKKICFMHASSTLTAVVFLDGRCESASNILFLETYFIKSMLPQGILQPSISGFMFSQKTQFHVRLFVTSVEFASPFGKWSLPLKSEMNSFFFTRPNSLVFVGLLLLPSLLNIVIDFKLLYFKDPVFITDFHKYYF
jgi:hypothetical protein